MRILMLGRGVIATVYGQAFQRAGHDVVHHVRPQRLAEYREPVSMDLIDGRLGPLGRRTQRDYAPRLQSSTAPDDRFDLVVISVGHHQLRDASAALAPHIGDATVVVLGNVWDELDAAVTPIPADQVVFGFPGAGGGFRTDGSLHGAVLRSVTLGTSGTAPPRRAQEARAVFHQAGFTVRDEPDIRGWLFLHVVLDAGMFAQAVERGGLARMIGDRRALSGAFRTSRELLPVLEARGVDLTRHRTASTPARFPGATGAALALATVVAPIARASLAAHDDPQGAEPRAVLLDLARTARSLGIATPRLDHAVARLTRPGPAG